MEKIVRPTVYVETSIVSYLVAWPSRDLVRTAHQQVTRDWWATRGNWHLFTSQFAVDEAAAGDPDAAANRLAALAEAELLDITEEAILLAQVLISGHALPSRARVDALHVAVAATHGMDYLVTWNCRHIANAALRNNIEYLCRSQGYEPPVICTPLELPKEK